MEFDFNYYKKAADYILNIVGHEVEIGLILGSSIGSVKEIIDVEKIIDYKDIPNFLISTAEGHEGKLIIGEIEGKKVVVMSGRFHYYEGYTFEELSIPIRVFKLLGVNKVILTNAAGAINKSFKPGDIVLIKDHIKLNGPSPLRGKNIEEFGPRFFDVTDMYTERLRDLAKTIAKKESIDVKEGVYFFATGPQFETKAEIKAMGILGADLVGMSTVTEALTAAHTNIEVLAMSLVTNMAAGIVDKKITTEEVEEIGKLSRDKLKKFISSIIEAM
ncbi:MAG TPA: purine-nucleoside phosphorylase [Soehngenia sp.]|nr:purine-nucleoside phosphorylase [Soehngenia sp.]